MQGEHYDHAKLCCKFDLRHFEQCICLSYNDLLYAYSTYNLSTFLLDHIRFLVFGCTTLFSNFKSTKIAYSHQMQTAQCLSPLQKVTIFIYSLNGYYALLLLDTNQDCELSDHQINLSKMFPVAQCHASRTHLAYITDSNMTSLFPFVKKNQNYFFV